MLQARKGMIITLCGTTEGHLVGQNCRPSARLKEFLWEQKIKRCEFNGMVTNVT